MLSKEDLERIYTDHERALFNIALRWTYDVSLAEELVQDAFVKVWDRRDQVQRDTAVAYVFRVLTNLCKNFARRRATRQRVRAFLAPLLPVKETRTPQSAVDHRELSQALKQLSPAQRQVVLMCEFSGLSQVEIGQALGVAPGTVASRRHAALARLKELMG